MSQIKLDKKEKKKELVLEAFDTLFNQRDYIHTIQPLWSSKYVSKFKHALESAAEAFDLMMSGKARFRAVLTTGN